MKRTKRHLISALTVAFITVALVGTTFALGLTPKLGLDLKGGLSVILTAPPNTPTDQLDKAVEILRGRVDRAGVAEPEISTQSDNNVFIQLPGTDEPDRLLNLIGKTAQLQFRAVQRMIPPGDPDFETTEISEDEDPEKPAVFVDDEGIKYQLSAAPLTGDAIRQATARPDQLSWDVVVDFNRTDADAWRDLTAELACNQGVTRQVAIVLDGIIEGHPQIDPSIACGVGIENGGTVITGSYTEAEAKDLALVLTAGALPVELTQSDVRVVSATLGNDALRAGLLAGAIGVLLVMLYMLIYYRTLGLQTWLSLIVFGAIIYGLVVVFGELIGWSLTLSGIAGLIVAVGIATDSNIVFYERVKEELHSGRSLRAAIDRGFTSSWRTMRAANSVTILAAVVLYVLAVGPVRGFAFALGMATALDLALTYSLTWPLAALLSRNHFFAENKLLGMRTALDPGSGGNSFMRKIYRSEFKIDFIGKRRMWFAISAALVGISALALIPGVHGLSYGIDFKGGSIYLAPAPSDVSVSAVKDAMTQAGLDQPVVQVIEDRAGGNSQVQVQTSASLSPEQRGAVTDALVEVTGADVNDIATESVGEKWGANITGKALRALVIFLVLAIAYMSWRLEPKMAAAGIIALLHDLAITAGVYAIVGFEVSPATVIATLTILGYSLYDTVVVFDRIKENEGLPAHSKSSFAQIANASSNQVLMRSISTSLTVLLPVGSLLFVGSFLLGAETLKDLALALFVGVAAGTYSSIFLATPALSVWKERESRYALAEARARRHTRSPKPVAGQDEGGGDEAVEVEDDLEPAAKPGPAKSRPAKPSPARRKNQSRAKRKAKR